MESIEKIAYEVIKPNILHCWKGKDIDLSDEARNIFIMGYKRALLDISNQIHLRQLRHELAESSIGYELASEDAEIIETIEKIKS